MARGELLRLLGLGEEAAKLAQALELPVAEFMARMLIEECAHALYEHPTEDRSSLVMEEGASPRRRRNTQSLRLVNTETLLAAV